MKTITIILLVIAVLVLGIGAYFVLSESSKDSSDNGIQISNSIEIRNFAYSPSTITISVGDTVTWTNMDSVQHTVTSDSGSELDSELLGNRESYSHTFNTAGTFNYHCTPHPNMKATVIAE